jgi:DNA invertase Pin-like site-specific DNA recombinase
MLRLIDYGRVSTDDQSEYGTGLETQRMEDDAYARLIGAVIVGYEQDPGVSGTIYPREGLERALRRIEAGEANGLLAHRVDRIGRKLWIPPVVFERLAAVGARLLTVQDGEVNDGNIMMFSIRCGMAQSDYQQIVSNMRAGKRRMAEKGFTPSRSTPPYGYHIVTKIEQGQVQENPGTYCIIEEQAEVVRKIFTLYASGMSMRGITGWLQDQGIATARQPRERAQGVWQRSTVQSILANPAYRGTVTWGKTNHRSRDKSTMTPEEQIRMKKPDGTYRVRVPAPLADHIHIAVPPIVDADLWERCQSRRAENRANTERSDRRHLLSGLLRCPTCGLRLTVQGSKGIGRITYYKCTTESAKLSEPCSTRKQLYPEREAKAALTQSMERLKDDPAFAAVAYAAHIEDPAPTGNSGDLETLQKKILELNAREEATVRAQISAIQTGARPEVYQQILTEIAQERQRLETKVAHMAVASVQRRKLQDIDVGTVARITAEAMLEVLASEVITTAEKNAALRRIVASMTPRAGGYEVRMRPFLEHDGAVHVQSMTMRWTCTGVEARFEGG